MFVVITVAYLIFWGPLFLVTLFSYGDYKTETPSTSHEVTLHVAFVHAFVNPTLFLVRNKRYTFHRTDRFPSLGSFVVSYKKKRVVCEWSPWAPGPVLF
jgi:hypothetical protein